MEGKILGRNKGSTNKQDKLPAVCALSVNERIQLLADLLIELVVEELWLKS